MKKIGHIVFAFLLVFSTFYYSSCLFDVSRVCSEERELVSDVVNYRDYVSSAVDGDSSRSIVAQPATSEDYSFWLVFNKVNVEDSVKTYVKVSSGGSIQCGIGHGYSGTAFDDGKFTIILENSEYLMTLYAVNKSTEKNYSGLALADKLIKDDAVFYGTTYVDLRNGPGIAAFTMTTKNLTGKSNLNFDVVLDKWGKIPSGNVDFEIKDLLTNEESTTSIGRSTKETVLANKLNDGVYSWISGTTRYGDESYYFNYSKDMTAGMYNFVVTFWDKDNKNILFKWSDVITVLPNRVINTPVYLAKTEPVPPSAPTNFMASYVKSSQDPVTDEYEVYFQWIDSDNFEDYFEMELLDVTTDAHNKAFHLCSPKGSSIGTLSDYYWDEYLNEHSLENLVPKVFNPNIQSLVIEEMYYSGGLWANNTELTLTLPLARRYVARIRSVNTVGKSAWTYVDLRGSSSPEKEPFDSESINMYKIVYHLNGGRYSADTGISDPYSDSEKSKYSTTDFIVYGIQDKTPRSDELVYPDGIDFWDGLHLWDSDGSGHMTTKQVGGSLKTGLSTPATDNEGTGASDSAILGGIWTKFDTDGNLVYEYASDTNFGKGSLQKVLDTQFHDSSKKDITAFKYWVDDVSKDVSEADINASLHRYDISGKYKGFENVELWAKYYVVKDPDAVEDTPIAYDNPKAYDLYTNWINYDQSATSGTHTYSAAAVSFTESTVLTFSKANGSYIGWRMRIPVVKYANTTAYNGDIPDKASFRPTSAYGLKSAASGIDGKLVWTDSDVLSVSEYEALPAETVAGDANDRGDYEKISYMYGLPKGRVFDSVTGVAYKSGSYEAGWASSITTFTQGSYSSFAEMDISKLVSGQTYRVLFTANYGKYTYQKSVEMKIVD